MNSFLGLLAKHKISILMWSTLAVLLGGGILRFAYVLEVGQHPLLNLTLPKTDLFAYDTLAKNAIYSRPFIVNTTVYPFTIGYISMIYRFLGTGHVSVYLINFLLSVISVGLLIAVGKNIFGWTSGILAGMGMMFYRMNFFYDGLKDGTALSQFLLVASLFAFVMFVKKKNKQFYLWFLVFVLLSCLMRYFYWLAAAPMIVFCIIRFKQWRQPFLIAANLLFIIVALFASYQASGAEGFQHRFAVHFHIGNRAGGSGLMGIVPGIAPTGEGFAKDTILAAYAETGSVQHVDRYWIKKTFDSYQNGYRDWLRLIGKKFSYLTNNFEPHNHSSVYFYEKHTNLKHFPRLNFAVLFSLAVVGVFLVFLKKHQAGKFLFILVIFLVIMILSIFITARYRMPLIPFLCLYAGFGIQEFIELVRKKNYLFVSMAFFAVVLAAIWSYHPVAFFNPERDIRFWEGRASKARRYYSRKDELRQRYIEWDKLNVGQKVLLTIQLEQHSMPHEFNEAYAAVFPLTDGDNATRHLLLRQRAQFEESNFNFQKALEIWEQLQESVYWRQKATKKIREIQIIGPLLDKNFKG